MNMNSSLQNHGQVQSLFTRAVGRILFTTTPVFHMIGDCWGVWVVFKHLFWDTQLISGLSFALFEGRAIPCYHTTWIDLRSLPWQQPQRMVTGGWTLRFWSYFCLDSMDIWEFLDDLLGCYPATSSYWLQTCCSEAMKSESRCPWPWHEDTRDPSSATILEAALWPWGLTTGLWGRWF